VLEEFLEQEQVAQLLAKDFVICGIDQDVMANGKIVSAALTKGVSGGIPWFVIFDPSKPVITKKGDDEGYTRREAAVLATADGPNGNVGCPMAKGERAHFLACLSAGRKNLNDDELLSIAESHRAFSAERNAKYGDAVDGIPAAPTGYGALEAAYFTKMEEFSVKWEAAQNGDGEFPEFPDFKEDFNLFRGLAKNYLAPPADRGRALLWCLENFGQSGIQWKNPGKVLTSLSNQLIDNYADADWAVGQLSQVIARNVHERSFNAAEAMMRLEAAQPNPAAKQAVAYARTMMWKGMDDEQWMADVAAFQKAYPESDQAKQLDQMIAVIANLKVGKMAPALAGKTIDGDPIALSDYKGKVVFLVFWGFW
jgi:hypothetical protein